MSTSVDTTEAVDNRIALVLQRLVLGDRMRPARPGLPSGQDMGRYLMAALCGVLACMVVSTQWFGFRLWAMWAIAFAGGVAVEGSVGLIRKRPIGGGSLVYSGLFVLLLPPSLPLWMVAVGMVFGTLFGKEAFGGTGSHVFSPVLVAKGFLLFSYPTQVQGVYFGNLLRLQLLRPTVSGVELIAVPDAWLVAAAVTLLAGMAIAAARPANLRIIVAILLAAVGVGLGLAQGERLPYGSLVELIGSDGFLFSACLLASDPACAPRDGQAAWLYGLLIGSVAVLMRTFSTYSEAMLCAVLLGNLAAPTFDYLAARPTHNRGEA